MVAVVVAPAQGADINYSSAVDGDDLDAFAQAFVEGAILADYNGDGEIDFLDVGEFIDAFIQGGG